MNPVDNWLWTNIFFNRVRVHLRCISGPQTRSGNGLVGAATFWTDGITEETPTYWGELAELNLPRLNKSYMP